MSAYFQRRFSRNGVMGIVAFGLVSVLLASCRGYEDGEGGGYEVPPAPAPSYSIGVSVTGLEGTGLQLKNGADTLAVSINGEATFPTKLSAGNNYAVTVSAQPGAPAQTCEVTQGNGAITNADVTDIAVRCVVSAAPRFAYAVNLGDDSISIYNVDAATGQLRSRGYAKTGFGPSSLTHDPAGKFSFVLNSGIDRQPDTPLAFSSISVFARDNVNGDLREVAGSPFVTSSSFAAAQALTVHPSGKFVYVTTADHSIFQWSVGPDGKLTAITENPVDAAGSPRKLVFDPRGRFAYLTHVGHESEGLYIYEVDATTGALRERQALRVQFPNRDLRTSNVAIHPNGKFAYVVNQEFASVPGSLSAFTVDATTGALTAIPGHPVELPIEATGVPQFDVSGRYAYVLAFGALGRRGSVAGFSVNLKSGAMTGLAGSPYELDFAPRGLSLTPSGDFLYVANISSQDIRDPEPAGKGTISAFKVDRATGVLTSIPGVDNIESPPFNASVDPSGRYLYTAGVTGDVVHAYRIGDAGQLRPLDQGAITRTGNQPISIQVFVSPTVPTPAVFTPKSVYVAGPPGNSITSFSVDPASGVLESTGSVFSAIIFPRALATSPDGKFLYGAELSGFASTFAINAVTGTLTESVDVPIAGGLRPVAIVADPSNRFVYVANHDDGTITAYRRNQDNGVLSANGDAVATGSSPISMAIDPTGRNLYVMSFAKVKVFGIDSATGKLWPVALDHGGERSLASGTGTQVAVEPGGKAVYVVSPLGSIEMFPVNPLSGALGSGVTRAIAAGSFTLAIDPTGRFLYTGDFNTLSITAFSISQQTGVITEIGRTPYPHEPRHVLADFSGKFLWVLSFDNRIATFGIDQGSGALTAIANLPQNTALATHLAAVGVVQ